MTDKPTAADICRILSRIEAEIQYGHEVERRRNMFQHVAAFCVAFPSFIGIFVVAILWPSALLFFLLGFIFGMYRLVATYPIRRLQK